MKKLVNYNAMLKDAVEHHYCIGGMNSFNLESVQAIIRAAALLHAAQPFLLFILSGLSSTGLRPLSYVHLAARAVGAAHDDDLSALRLGDALPL